MSNVISKLREWFAAFVAKEKAKTSPLRLLTHPIDTVEEMKEKRTGSFFSATILLLLYTISEIIVTVAKGFLFNTARPEEFDLFFVCCRSLFLILLFVLANWALCTLLDGEGRMIDIYIYSCYCLTPLIVFKIFDTIISNLVTSDEYVFVSMVEFCAMAWFLCLLIFSLKRLHNYTMKKILFNLLLSVAGMIVIFFLIFLFVVLMQQLYIFGATIVTEITMRSMA